jgi:hypothetical protein
LQTHVQTYTCGINMFWVDLQWSATPGVPLRQQAIQHLADTVFCKPASPGVIHIAVSGPDFRVLDHRGALLRVSPEELTAAVTLAIARDIKTCEPTETLEAWRQIVLSTTCTFKVLPSATARYWYALQQRELVSIQHTVVHRSTFQRVHEVSRLMKRMLETRPASEAFYGGGTGAPITLDHFAPTLPALVCLARPDVRFR